MSTNVLALLPELILTLTGVLVMLTEPCLKPASSRKPLGWIAIAGTVGALFASWYQVSLGTIHAFSNTIQVDAFSVLFHYVIGAVVLVTLLGSLDYFEGNASHAGEYFALLCFGAVGMMLMTCSVELLMVFVGLEISSITTYILCGFRKGQATGSESSIKYFLLGSFATAFFLYGVALAFGATGSTDIYAIALGLQTTNTPYLAFTALALILIGLGFKVSAAPFHVWTPDVYQGAPAPVVGMMSTAPKAAAFAVLLRITFTGFPQMQHRWTVLVWVLAALSMTIGNLGALLQRDVKRLLAYSSIAHAGYLLVAFTAFPYDGIAAACFYTATYAAMQVGASAVITQISGYDWLAVIGLLNSGIACFYYLRLLAAVYTKPGAESARLNELRPISVSAAVGLALAAMATLILGILPSGAVSFAEYASHSTLIEQARQECAAHPEGCHLQLNF